MPHTRSPDIDPVQVLVVDDEAGIAELLSDLLQAAGYAVVMADSGRSALRWVQQRRFDAIVCDLRMPDVDGPALWRQLREQQPALARRMLFVTGDTLSLATRSFLADAGCPSLDKPFRRAELLQRMAALTATPAPATPRPAAPGPAPHGARFEEHCV